MSPGHPRFLCRLAAFAAVLLLFVSGPRAATPETITVATDDNYPPYIFRDASGEIDGYLVDAWKLWEGKTVAFLRDDAPIEISR